MTSGLQDEYLESRARVRKIGERFFDASYSREITANPHRANAHLLQAYLDALLVVPYSIDWGDCSARARDTIAHLEARAAIRNMSIKCAPNARTRNDA